MSPDTELLSGGWTILPEPVYQEHQAGLQQRLEQLGSSLSAEVFQSLLDPLMRETVVHGFAEAGADEGTIWLLDAKAEHLVPVFNSGPQAAAIVGRFKQPLKTGLICMVLATEQPFLENEVWKNAKQSKLLDSLLQVQTCAMIAVPLYFLRGCRGVISCVQVQRTGQAGHPPGFRPEHLASVQRMSLLLSKLIDLRCLSRAVGWSTE